MSVAPAIALRRIRSGIVENARVAWLLGMRSRAVRGILVLGVLLLLVAFLAGAFSLRQPLVVTLDIGLSGIRLMTLLLALFWIQEAFARDIERKTVVLPMIFPVPRWAYVLGRLAGVCGLLALAVAIWGMSLYIATQFADWGYAQSSRPVFGLGYLLVLAGIILDAAVIASFALAVSSVSTTPLLPLFCGAMFAIAARAIGPIVDYLEFSAKADPVLRTGLLPVLKAVRWLIPDLARIDFRAICLYESWPAMPEIVSALCLTLGYLFIMGGLAVAAYDKREFS